MCCIDVFAVPRTCCCGCHLMTGVKFIGFLNGLAMFVHFGAGQDLLTLLYGVEVALVAAVIVYESSYKMRRAFYIAQCGAFLLSLLMMTEIIMTTNSKDMSRNLCEFFHSGDD